MNEIQNYPSTNSPAIDAFETLVDLYYQTNGYMTASGKWFWYWDKANGRKQRGYQDIDVLAMNGNETMIVSVTSNLDDKVRHMNDGSLHLKLLNKLKTHFDRAESYLKTVPEYQWLLASDRKVKRVVAYINVKQSYLQKISPVLREQNIELLSGPTIFHSLSKYLAENKNLKIQHPQLKMLLIQEWANKWQVT